MTASPKFHLGQTVLLISHRMEPVEVEITRVGRTNVAIQRFGREQVFNAATGVDPRNRIGEPDRIATPEMLADEKRHKGLEDQIRGLGVVAYGVFRYYSSDTLAKLLHILETERIDS